MTSTDIESQFKNEISSKEIEHASVHESFSAEEEKALLRKIDLTLLPTIWVMYLLSYLDRTKYVIPSPKLHAGYSSLTTIPCFAALAMRKSRECRQT
jgi:hypothetical protein